MSQAVISSNQSIKTERRHYFSGATISTTDVTIYSASSYEYLEVYYLWLNAAAGNCTISVYDPTSSTVIYTVTSGANNYTYSRIASEMQSFSTTSGNGTVHPQKLTIPNGCELRVRVSSPSFPGTVKMIGTVFINSP